MAASIHPEVAGAGCASADSTAPKVALPESAHLDCNSASNQKSDGEIRGFYAVAMSKGPVVLSMLSVLNAVPLAACADVHGTEDVSNVTLHCQVYGVRASSLISIAFTGSAILLGLLSPVIGAIVDSTKYRRAVLLVGSYGMVLSAGLICLTLSPRLWIISWLMLMTMSIVGTMSDNALNAYLPEIVSGEREMTRVSTVAVLLTYTVQLVFGILMGAVSVASKLGPLDFTQLSLSIGCAYMLVFVTYGAFKLESRPASLTVGEGSSVIFSGFRRLSKTLNTIRRDYPDLLLVFIGEAFYTSATSSAVSLSSVFLLEKANMGAEEIMRCFVIGMIFVLPGAYFSKILAGLITLRRSLMLMNCIWMVSIGVLPLVVHGENDVHIVYILYIFYGITLGMSSTLCRLGLHDFFVYVMDGGPEKQ